MIGSNGMVLMSRFIAAFDRLTQVVDEIELAPHQVTPNCWCFTNMESRRAFQIKLVYNTEGCELDYISPDGKLKLVGVYDCESLANRAHTYLMGKSNEI